MKKVYIEPSMAIIDTIETAILAGSPEPSADPSQSSTTMDSKTFDFIIEDDDINF